jgi:hypothetical protein
MLDGHTDEVFSCEFSEDGGKILTSSKDNTWRIWHGQEQEPEPQPVPETELADRSLDGSSEGVVPPHSKYVVGQRVVVTLGDYRGDEGIVVRQVGAKTVYKFQVLGVWSDAEWAYDSAAHQYYGLEPKDQSGL